MTKFIDKLFTSFVGWNVFNRKKLSHRKCISLDFYKFVNSSRLCSNQIFSKFKICLICQICQINCDGQVGWNLLIIGYWFGRSARSCRFWMSKKTWITQQGFLLWQIDNNFAFWRVINVPNIWGQRCGNFYHRKLGKCPPAKTTVITLISYLIL